MKNLKTSDLIFELQIRGYYTDLLFCLEDVKMNLEWINESRLKDIELTDDDSYYILEKINSDWHIERINEKIRDIIEDNFGDEEY
jgi:hypothetical protein